MKDHSQPCHLADVDISMWKLSSIVRTKQKCSVNNQRNRVSARIVCMPDQGMFRVQ